MTTLIVAIAIVIVFTSLFFFGRRYEEDEPIHHRAMTPDVPSVPMSESTMPESDVEHAD